MKNIDSGRMDREVKVGDKIIFMDSNLRGTIVALHPKIEVELEDGFVIDAYRQEFIVTDSAQMEALGRSVVESPSSGKMSPKKVSCSKGIKGAYGVSSTIKVDLHLEALPYGRSVSPADALGYQLRHFRDVMYSNLKHRGRRICFIHGVGDGVLKMALRKELDEVFSHRCSYIPGVAGETIVTIK